MKLSKTQQDIIDKMKDGWELGHSTWLHGWWWLQQGGVGRGGKTQDVRGNTARALLVRKLIVLKKARFPTHLYRLK